MGQPIATTQGVCAAFPDVLKTPSPPGPPVPVPYPNIAQLSAATGTATTVTAGGRPVITEHSSIGTSSGGEAGTGGGPRGEYLGPCTFESFSKTVTAEGGGVVRQGDTTSQNDGNATGTVTAGLPTVLVGG